MTDEEFGGIRSCPDCGHQPTVAELVESDGYCPRCRHNPAGPTHRYDVTCPRCETDLGIPGSWEEAKHVKEIFNHEECANCGYDGPLAVVGRSYGGASR